MVGPAFGGALAIVAVAASATGAAAAGHVSAAITHSYSAAGSLAVGGRVHVSEDDQGRQTLAYRLRGVDSTCADGGTLGDASPDLCGLRIHEGSGCALGTWTRSVVDLHYSASGDSAQGSAVLPGGTAVQEMHGLFVVINNRQGEPVACGRLEEIPLAGSDSCYTEEEWRQQSLLNFSGAFERCGPEMVCVQGHRACEDFCVLSEDCERYPLRTCDDVTMTCRHKFVFETVPGVDVAVALLFWVISGMALSAGIGGGGLYVPLLMLVLGFSVREATALSQACLAGGATTNLFYTMRQQHPSKPRPAIDYNLLLIMGPSLLIGALFGSTLNASAPSWLILSLLLIVLVRSAFEAFRKAMSLWRAEQEQKIQGARPPSRLAKNPVERLLRCLCLGRYSQFEESSSQPPSPTGGNSPSGPPSETLGAGGEPAAAAAAEEAPTAEEAPAATDEAAADTDSGLVDIELESEPDRSAPVPVAPAPQEPKREPQYPKGSISLLVCMWLVTVLSVFARGGRAAPGLVPYCSVAYWLTGLGTILALLGLAVLATRQAVRQSARSLAMQAPAEKEEGDLVWTLASARRICIWSLLAGALAALCGIGGGMVMGPLLLRLGFSPKVQSATTGTTLFVMSTATALSFLVQGVAPKGYALFLASSTGMGALVGKALVGWVVKRSGHESLLGFLLGGLITLSVIVMGITGGIDVANDIREGRDMMFQGFCSAS